MHQWKSNTMKFIATTLYAFLAASANAAVLRGNGDNTSTQTRHLLQAGMDDPHFSRLSNVDTEKRMNEFCVNIINQGTWVYLWGCTLFLAQSVISMVVSIIMNKTEKNTLKMCMALGRGSSKPRALNKDKAAQTEDLALDKAKESASVAKENLTFGPGAIEEALGAQPMTKKATLAEDVEKGGEAPRARDKTA